MALTERTRAYETLIRHNSDGSIGAHHAQIAEVLRDGVVISASPLPPADVTSNLAPVLGENLALALAENARLVASAVQLQGDKDVLLSQSEVLRSDNGTLRIDNEALRSENEALRSENEALQSQIALLNDQAGASAA